MSESFQNFFHKNSWKKPPIFDANLRSYTSFRCNGKAKVIVKVCSIEELQKIISFSQEKKIPFLILGKGSNSIFTDKGFYGTLICLDGNFKKIKKLENHQVLIGAGVSTTRLASWLKKNLLGGGEFLLGIPASIGGAIFMNAGANENETKQLLLQIESFSLQKGLRQKKAHEIIFGYRYSSFMEKKEIITSATLQFFPKKKKIIEQEQIKVIEKRKNTQPIHSATWGSVFKNPKGHFAAQLIEQCGFKGRFFGGLQVSNMHCNFFENKKNATYNDIEQAICEIQKTVFEQYQIFLYPEVRIFDPKGQLIKKFYQSF